MDLWTAASGESTRGFPPCPGQHYAAPAFGGVPARKRMLGGQVGDLRVAADYLNAARGGDFMSMEIDAAAVDPYPLIDAPWNPATGWCRAGSR